MKDSEVIKIFSEIINQGFIDQAVPFIVDLKSAYQPINVGVSANSGVYFSKLRDELLGSPLNNSKYDEQNEEIKNNFKQYVQSVYQIQVFHKPDVFDEDALTANDLARIVRNSLQLSSNIYTMNNNGLGVSKVGEIKNMPYRDDKNQFNMGPLFEIVLTHADEITRVGEALSTQKIGIFPI